MSVDVGKLRALLVAVQKNGNESMWPDLAIASIEAMEDLLAVYGHPRRTIYQQIDYERSRQKDDLDNSRPRAAWSSLLNEHVSRAIRAGNHGDPDEWRHRMLVIAALAVAAVEAHDRRRESEPIMPLTNYICGSSGVDDAGLCVRCGLVPDGVYLCPPGYIPAETPEKQS